MLIAAALAASLPLVPATSQSTPLSSAVQWEVQSDGNVCFATRSHGGEAVSAQPQLILRQTPGDPSVGILLVSDHKGAGFNRKREGVLALSPGGKTFPIPGLQDYTNAKNDKRLIVLALRDQQLEAFKAAREMRLTSGKDIRHHLQLVGLEQGLAANAACRRQVIRSWGFDPDVIDGLRSTATPISNPGEWVRSTDYPKAALSRRERGSVRLRFTVTATGKVEDCVVIESASPTLDGETCRLVLARARYSPALDKDGKPVATFKSFHFGWWIP